MVFAGIWASRIDPDTDQWHRTCSIITTASEGVISAIHHRMPVTLARSVWDAWIDRDLTDPEAARSLMKPKDKDLLMEHPVSRKVNSVRNNEPGLRAAIEPETLF
jgi:putative SOS response-associated peptidase YedK